MNQPIMARASRTGLAGMVSRGRKGLPRVTFPRVARLVRPLVDRTAGERRNLRAALLLAFGMSLFLVNDALVKRLGESLPVGQVLFGRAAIICLILSAVLRLTGAWPSPGSLARPVLLVRGVLELCITGMIVASLSLLSLTYVTVLALTAPIVLTALSARLLGERVTPARWAAVLLGFVGAFVFIRPTAPAFALVALLPLLAAALVGARDLATRQIAGTIDTTVIVLVSAAIVALGGLATAPFGWQPIDATLAFQLVLAGAFNAGAYWCAVQATRLGELSYIAPFRYVQIPEAAIIGFFVWGELPALHEVIGALLVIGAGVAVLLGDRPAPTGRPAPARAMVAPTTVYVDEPIGALEAFRSCWQLSPQGWAFFEAQLDPARGLVPEGYRPRSDAGRSAR